MTIWVFKQLQELILTRAYTSIKNEYLKCCIIQVLVPKLESLTFYLNDNASNVLSEDVRCSI